MDRKIYIQNRQGVFNCLELGKGEQHLAFVHGNSLNAQAYHPFLSRFSRQAYHVLAPDLRGHGRSCTYGDQKLSNWNVFLDDLESILKERYDHPVIGMGHSMGGFFIYALAKRNPALFKALILIDPIIFVPTIIRVLSLSRILGVSRFFPLPRRTRKKRNRFSGHQEAIQSYTGKGMFKTWTDEALAGYVAGGLEKEGSGGYRLSCDPELEARLYETVPADTWHGIENIRVPVLLIRGAYSDLFSRRAANLLTQLLNQCHYMEIEKTGHFLPMEIPERLSDLIVRQAEQVQVF